MTQDIGRNLAQLRREHGYSQEKLAERLGVSEQEVSKWERAESAPDTDHLIALAKLYGCTLDALVQPAKAVDAELPEGSFYAQDKPKEPQRPRFRKDFPYPVLVAFLYLVLGFCFNLWHPGWIIFLTVPLFYLPDSERGYLRLLSNPIMVTIIYLLLGCYCNLWHPGWIIFLLVPIMNAVLRK